VYKLLESEKDLPREPEEERLVKDHRKE